MKPSPYRAGVDPLTLIVVVSRFGVIVGAKGALRDGPAQKSCCELSGGRDSRLAPHKDALRPSWEADAQIRCWGQPLGPLGGAWWLGRWSTRGFKRED